MRGGGRGGHSGGDREGQKNVAAISDDAASRGLEVLRQISSTGYLRKRLPQELIVLQGGSTTARSLDMSGPMSSLAVAMRSETSIEAVSAVMIDPRTKAKMQGYEGDPCGECGNYTLVRNGTCMKCNTCGGTSGCS